MLPFGQPLPHHSGHHAPLPPPPDQTTNEESDIYELENFDGSDRVPPRPHIPPPSTGPIVPIVDMPWYWGNISRYMYMYIGYVCVRASYEEGKERKSEREREREREREEK